MSTKTPSATLSVSFTYARDVNICKSAAITQVVVLCDHVRHVLQPAPTWQLPGNPHLTLEATALAHKQVLPIDDAHPVSSIKIATTVKTITVVVTFFRYHKKTAQHESWEKTSSLPNMSQLSESKHYHLSITCDRKHHLSTSMAFMDPKELARLETGELRKLFWAAEVRLFRIVTDFVRAMLVPSDRRPLESSYTTIVSLQDKNTSNPQLEDARLCLYEQLVKQAKTQVACDPEKCIAIFNCLQRALENRRGLNAGKVLEQLCDPIQKLTLGNTNWKILDNPSIPDLLPILRDVTFALMQARDQFLDSLQASVNEATRRSLQTNLVTCKTNHMDLVLTMYLKLQSDPTASVPPVTQTSIVIPKVQEVIPSDDPFPQDTTQEIKTSLKEDYACLRDVKLSLEKLLENSKTPKDRLQIAQKNVIDWEEVCAQQEAILSARRAATEATMDPILREDPATRWLLSEEELCALNSIQAQGSTDSKPLCIQHFITAYAAMQQGTLFMTESNTPFNPFYFLDEMTSNTCPKSPGFLAKTAHRYSQTKDLQSVGKTLEQIVSNTQKRLNLYLLEIQKLRI